MTKRSDKIQDLQAQLVQAVIDSMENDPGAWTRPWVSAFASGMPLNAKTGNRYQGGNAWWLAIAGSADDRCELPFWATYKQWQLLGGQIRKGETGQLILVPREFVKTETDTDGVEESKLVRYFATASVFNACQQDGATLPESPQVDDPIAAADEFYGAVGAVVSSGWDRACYVPMFDTIQMPEFASFRDAPSYYSTLGHEHVHWTGHADRCDRKLTTGFGSDEYAFEELVAELGAVLLGAQLGYETEPRPDHGAYLVGWRKQLADDPKVMWRAATLASKAVEFLTGRATERAAKLADRKAPVSA